MLRDADELTQEEKTVAVAAQTEALDPIQLLAEHLGCKPEVDDVAAELARLVEFSNAAEELADELGLDTQQARQAQMYVDGVKELNAQIAELQPLAELGRVVSEAFGLSRLSEHIVSNSADPISALKRETQLGLSFTPVTTPAVPNLAERLAYHLNLAPEVST
jgi:hypothetical protein